MRTKLVIIIGLIVLAILLIPTTVACGVPGYTCTTAPDENGIIRRNYDVQPLGVTFFETLMHSSVPIRYSRGYTEQQI